jgi:hypothetical protein
MWRSVSSSSTTSSGVFDSSLSKHRKYADKARPLKLFWMEIPARCILL